MTELDILLRFQCSDCGKEFTVLDDQIETDELNCPHCNGDVEVPEEDEADED